MKPFCNTFYMNLFNFCEHQNFFILMSLASLFNNNTLLLWFLGPKSLHNLGFVTNLFLDSAKLFSSLNHNK